MDNMRQDIEYLCGRANITREEAEELLKKNNNSVVRVLLDLEQQGRVNISQEGNRADTPTDNWQRVACDKGEETLKMVKKALNGRLVVDKTVDGNEQTILNVNMPVAIGAAIIAPYLALASVAVGAVTGFRMRVVHTNDDEDQQAPQVS